MKNTNNYYLINKLKEGRKLDIVLLSHNAYWPDIQRLDDFFGNCNVTVFGGSTFYIKFSNNQIRNRIKNCDLIIFYSSGNYDKSEFEFF